MGLAVENLLNDDEILNYLGGPKKELPQKEKSNSFDSSKKRKAYTVEEVSEMFGVSVSKVKQWINEKQLKATKIGSTWLVPSSEVEKISNPKK